MSQLFHLVAYPEIKTEKPPMLVMLHGYGSDEKDLFSFAGELTNRFLVISFRAPIRLMWGGNAWYDINFTESAERFGDPEQALESMNQLKNAILHAQQAYDTHPEQTVILGFSQGAILSYALSMHYPALARHVLALSGYLFHEILPEKTPQHLPEYYVTHGAADAVIPVEWARNAVSYLNQNNIRHQYHEYEKLGHGIDQECFQDMMIWIAQRYAVLESR